MSDDVKNPKENQTIMADLFMQNASEPDPNELPDDIAFQAAEDDVHEESETVAESKGGSAEESITAKSDTDGLASDSVAKQAGTPNLKVVPIGGQAGETLTENVINPDLSDATRDSANKLRERVMLDPVITGKDADLVRWNPDSQRIEPVNREAAAMLSKMGDNADIYCYKPGELLEKPLKFDPESFSLKPNAAKPAKPIQSAQEIQRGGITGIVRHGLQDRMKRMTNQDPDSERDKLQKEAADRRIERAMQDDAEKRHPSQESRVATTGEMLMARMGDGLGKLLSSLGRFLKVAAAKLASAGERIGNMITKIGQERLGNRSPSFAHEIPDVTPKASSEQVASIGPEGAAGAAEGIVGRMKTATQNVQRASHEVVESYRTTHQKNIQNLTKGLGTHEIGNPIINSQDVYREQLASRSPQDKAKVTKALNANRALGKKLAGEVSGVVEHPDMSMVPSRERATVLQGLQASLSSAVKLDALTQHTVNNAADQKGTSFAKQAEQNVSQATEALRSALAKAKEQAEIEDMARTTADASPAPARDDRPGLR